MACLCTEARPLLSTDRKRRTTDRSATKDVAKRRFATRPLRRVFLSPKRTSLWLGRRATILKNVTIGDGAIVAAGSIVTKNVPPICAVAGIPAKVVRRRVTWSLSPIKVSGEEKQFIAKARKAADRPKRRRRFGWLSRWLCKLTPWK